MRGLGRSDLARFLALAFVLALFLLPGIGRRDLWNPDEPRYAEVAREMLETPGGLGDLLVPRLNGALYTQKPPLHFWSIALAGALRGGVDETAARLPSFLACVLAAWAVFLLGRTLFDERTGWLAALVFAACGQIQWQARVGQIDMTLAALVALAVAQWASAHFGGRAVRVYGFWALTGLATVAKGPVGLLPALFSILVFLGLSKDREGLQRLRLGRGLLLWLAVVLLWFAPAVAVAGRSYFDALIFEQTLERYASASGHLRPWYYYLRTLPGSFAPFTLLAPAAAWALWRGRSGEPRRAAVRFLAVWILVTVLFFSLSAGKRTVYMVPTLAPLSLLFAYGIERLAARRPSRSGLLAAGAATLLFALLGALFATPRLVADLPSPSIFGADLVTAARITILPATIGFALALALAWRGSARSATAAVGLGLAATMTVATVWLLPRADAVKSARPLALELTRTALPGEPYAIYPLPDAGFLFYSRRFSTPIQGEAGLRAYVARPERVWLLIERDELAALDPPLSMVEVTRDDDWEQGHVLMTTPPWPRAARDEARPHEREAR
jgi:4-amino-4-deoxy-L-arabinose transferase-like glycosyltransferase